MRETQSCNQLCSWMLPITFANLFHFFSLMLYRRPLSFQLLLARVRATDFGGFLRGASFVRAPSSGLNDFVFGKFSRCRYLLCLLCLFQLLPPPPLTDAPLPK